MPYDVATCIADVRMIMPNVTTSVYADAKLTYCATLAMRRLFRDKPRDGGYDLVGNGGKYYDLGTLITDWIVQVSSIRKIIRPTEGIIANSKDQVMLYEKEFQIYYDPATSKDMLYLVDAMMGTQHAAVTYRTPWLVSGIDGAITSTLPVALQAAVEFLTAAIACYALATQAAGVTNSSIAGDLIDYRSKQREYAAAAKDWELQYAKEIGLNQPVTAAAVIADFDPVLQTGLSYATHYRR